MTGGSSSRIRAAAVLALAMAVVLAGCGALIYVLVDGDLADSLDRDLQQRAQDLAALVTTRPGSLARVETIDRGMGFAELLNPAGRVVDATPTLGTATLLRPDQVRHAQRSQVFADIPGAPGLGEPARLLAVPVERGGRSFVLVVGESRENQSAVLGSLRDALYIAGPIALALATAIGYLLGGSRGRRRSVPTEPIEARDLFESVRSSLPGRAIEIDDPDELRLEGDRPRLEQAMGRLADNALRHGGGTVRLQAIRVGDCVELHVRDEGPGFPSELLPDAFERGRSLALVSAVAGAHGGTVGARNDGHLGGADIWISIPDRRR